MNIRLKNIGIVKDSVIKLDGLTIITGKNNSGKTTVGKSLYSLIDAVNNLENKASADTGYYIIEQLDRVSETLRFFRYVHPNSREKLRYTLRDFPAIYYLILRDYRRMKRQLEYAQDLLHELESLDLSLFDEVELDMLDMHIHNSVLGKEQTDSTEIIGGQIQKAISILRNVLHDISKDPDLIDYARESINQTLKMEFSSQIQPINGCEESSEIELVEDGIVSFRVAINNNRVVDDRVPVYLGSQLKRAFLIDDPFILDGTSSYVSRPRYNPAIDLENESLLNPNRIQSHANKLKAELHKPALQTVFEQTLSSTAITNLKDHIDAILPGTFEFTENGDYYVHNGKKLSVANLATGSKMFSIVKLLLEKGELDSSTMLILDEPEAHLHPMWQNSFAEIIVLLVKELGVNILLTTHSPNFVLALDAFMRKYEIHGKTNFYQTNTVDDVFVEYSCVNDDISSIYADFLRFLSDVKVLRDKYLLNGEDDE